MFSATWLSSLLFCRDTGDILLKICNVMPQDTGIYTCVAVNDHGSSSSSASIKVQGLITIPVGLWFRALSLPLKQHLLCSSCRYPSSPWEACGPGGQHLSSDGPLGPSSFIYSLRCQQLLCGVQTGGCVCVYRSRGRRIFIRNISTD